MNRERHKLDQVGIGGRIRIGRREGPARLQQTLGKIFHRAGDHDAGVCQIEALCDGAGKIQCLGNHHLAGRTREVEGNVVAKHMPMILQALIRLRSLRCPRAV
jgi:hypothetical protein